MKRLVLDQALALPGSANDYLVVINIERVAGSPLHIFIKSLSVNILML